MSAEEKLFMMSRDRKSMTPIIEGENESTSSSSREGTPQRGAGDLPIETKVVVRVHPSQRTLGERSRAADERRAHLALFQRSHHDRSEEISLSRTASSEQLWRRRLAEPWLRLDGFPTELNPDPCSPSASYDTVPECVRAEHAYGKAAEGKPGAGEYVTTLEDLFGPRPGAAQYSEGSSSVGSLDQKDDVQSEESGDKSSLFSVDCDEKTKLLEAVGRIAQCRRERSDSRSTSTEGQGKPQTEQAPAHAGSGVPQASDVESATKGKRLPGAEQDKVKTLASTTSSASPSVMENVTEQMRMIRLDTSESSSAIPASGSPSASQSVKEKLSKLKSKVAPGSTPRSSVSASSEASMKLFQVEETSFGGTAGTSKPDIRKNKPSPEKKVRWNLKSDLAESSNEPVSETREKHPLLPEEQKDTRSTSKANQEQQRLPQGPEEAEPQENAPETFQMDAPSTQVEAVAEVYEHTKNLGDVEHAELRSVSGSSGSSSLGLMGDCSPQSPDSGRQYPLGRDVAPATPEALENVQPEAERPVVGPDYETTHRPIRVNGLTTIADQLDKWVALDSGYPRVFAFSFLTPRVTNREDKRYHTALTTGELALMAKRMARVLRDYYSVVKGTVVCNLLPLSPERVVLDMAIVLAGGIVLSLDSEPRENESVWEYTEYVKDALWHAVCQLAFCVTGSAFQSYSRHTLEKIATGRSVETLTVVGVTQRIGKFANRGFLHSLWIANDIGEFVDPTLKPDDPAAIFVDTNEGSLQLVFYQHQAVLQLGAQLTQVLQLDRGKDIFFNPCPPSQPWGFPAAYLFSGVHTLAFDLLPCEPVTGALRNYWTETLSWPWSELCRHRITVALFVSPVLNLFHDYFVAKGESFRSTMLNTASLRTLEPPYLPLSRAAIAGSLGEIEEGVRMLKRCQVDVIKAVLVSVSAGVMTSLRVPEKWRKVPIYIRREGLGNCLTHLQMAMEDPDRPGEVLLCLEEGKEPKVSHLMVRSLYNMPCPIRRYDGSWTCWEPFAWTPLDLMGYVDHAYNVHVVGDTRRVFPLYDSDRCRWEQIDVQRVAEAVKNFDRQITDAQAIHLTVNTDELPMSFNHELIAVVCCLPYSWHTVQVQLENALKAAKEQQQPSPFGPLVKQFMCTNSYPRLPSGHVDRARLMSHAWAARTKGNKVLVVIDASDSDSSDESNGQEKRKSMLQGCFPCLSRR
ncbi:hypothetical protein ACOMHN_005570 [Nucella lapillus]